MTADDPRQPPQPVGNAPPVVSAVVAMTPDGVIGRDGDMPWRLSSDLRRFKRLTIGGVLIMGRKTFDSIGRPLPGRETIVLTRRDDFSVPGVHRAADPRQALEMARQMARGAAVADPPERPQAGRGQVFVVGGAEIYRQLLPACDQLLLTLVEAELTGDTRVEIDLTQFRVLELARFPAGERDDFPTSFQRMWRKSTPLQNS